MALCHVTQIKILHSRMPVINKKTNRVVLVFVAEYLLCFDQSLHHALVQRQSVFIGGRIGQLGGIVLNIAQQHADLLVLHRHCAPGPRDLRQTRRLPLMGLLDQFLQETALHRSSLTALVILRTSRATIDGRRAFYAATTSVWNGLPEAVRSSSSLALFEKLLKTNCLQGG